MIKVFQQFIYMSVRALPAAFKFGPIVRILYPVLILIASCSYNPPHQPAGETPAPTPTPPPHAVIAFLKDGELWATDADKGSTERLLAALPPGEVISDFVWSVDGSGLFFLHGLQINRVDFANTAIEPQGTLAISPDLLVDHIETTSDSDKLIISTLDTNGNLRSFSFKFSDKSTSELSIDQIDSLAVPSPPIVRSFSDLSVCPDQYRVLFKEVVGVHEELFIAELESGARMKLTDIARLGGFEASAETDGARRILEAGWSPDGRFVIFNPAQSCSESGLCYGFVYIVDSLGGAPRQLTQEMSVGAALDWSHDGKHLVFEDGGQIFVAELLGGKRRMTNGSRPRWRPASLNQATRLRNITER